MTGLIFLYMCVHMCAHMHVESKGQPKVSSSKHLEIVSHWPGAHQLGWTAGTEAQGPSCPSPSLGITGAHHTTTETFPMGSGDGTQVFAQVPYHLNYLPNFFQ